MVTARVLTVTDSPAGFNLTALRYLELVHKQCEVAALLLPQNRSVLRTNDMKKSFLRRKTHHIICCTTEGFSNPYAYIPLSKSSFKSIASKVVHISSHFVAISSELKEWKTEKLEYRPSCPYLLKNT